MNYVENSAASGGGRRQQLSTVQRTGTSVGPRPRGRSARSPMLLGFYSQQTSKHPSALSAIPGGGHRAPIPAHVQKSDLGCGIDLPAT
jgi:hypothetical protein